MNKYLILLLLLVGCAGAPETEPPSKPDPCREEGGVWYKNGNNHDLVCIDKAEIRKKLEDYGQSKYP